MSASTGSSSFLCELNGLLRDPHYHRCRLLLQELSILHPQFLSKLHGMIEQEYLDYVRTTALPHDVKQRHLQHTGPFFLVSQRTHLADEDAFIAFAIEKTQRSRSDILVAAAFGAQNVGSTTYAAVDAEEELQIKAEAAAREALFRYRQVSGNEHVYLLFAIDGQTLPRVEIELFARICPRTCANFVAFCEGIVPDISDESSMLSYKGNYVHRVVKGGWIQAGDVSQGPNGHGNGPLRSLYGMGFPDESFAVSHDQIGIVSMANNGVPHTNGSQFFITVAPLPWLDKKKVAFGRVVSGLTTIHAIAALETVQERPCVPCKIVDAGRLNEL
ncbi:hypothetical protein Poli38472_006631 [Pythium oligandrum]|uniref:PPIase cyclophilin-type domain-containing protein n=1 Tax=Pythium oligandrum TaxID=41045 RepID=A0A8K1C548_PYTOL|nr:hypothetical protein Poli38472_006631 [Pythium oligandrum]|eukprot:TMW56621.1 hypothetical protein Poli38472_006631 [Pythium oligandrum]